MRGEVIEGKGYMRRGISWNVVGRWAVTLFYFVYDSHCIQSIPWLNKNQLTKT